VLSKIADIVAGRCDLCRQRTVTDFSVTLKNNFDYYKVDSTKLPHRICNLCYEQKSLAKCGITGKIFERHKSKNTQYIESEIARNLSTYNRYCNFNGELSPEGYDIVLHEHEIVQMIFKSFIGGTKKSKLPNYNTINTIKRIEADGHFSSVEEVERDLRWAVAQLHGNAYIELFWDKHVKFIEERYHAGNGPNGNPYYKTRHHKKITYTGRALAVSVKPELASSGDCRGNQEKNSHRPRSDVGDAAARHRATLGLGKIFTRNELGEAYRQRMKEYHPDRVSGLGKELKQLAEQKAKDINEAFAFFIRKSS
jgi:hypothetical protein